ncbi:hypothetical protein GWE18_00845 [Bradyrhizobium sp. CSA112]|uniref:hypothetical protein n=1 Tax=Bradyrhizobium sp. CSA112 TaxID=2699170 RepID=UPI0023AF6F8B|nr:hypothetical protein [Bradyrhizobium sp. CSA112]MDE5451421.1 hypothetical protein [Bradyrhizobium sp. CSA112]
MLELLFGSTLVDWGPPILAYVQQNPWRVFYAILVAALLIDWMVNDRSGNCDGGLDFGSGDGDGGGD